MIETLIDFKLKKNILLLILKKDFYIYHKKILLKIS